MSEVITKLEKEAAVIAYKPKRLEKFKTVDEVLKDYRENPTEYRGINYDDRVAFLEANGYEVTRKNLIDPELSAKPPKGGKRGLKRR